MPWDRLAKPRRVDQAEPGFFLVKFAKDAMPVACRIIRWEDGMWQAVVGGEMREPHEDWVHARDVDRIWLRGQPCSEGDYQLFLTRAAFARQYAQDHPAANPTAPVNWRRMKP
jgi:hypothetical protein